MRSDYYNKMRNDLLCGAYVCMFAYKANKEYVEEVDATLDGKSLIRCAHTTHTGESFSNTIRPQTQRESVKQTEKAYERSEQWKNERMELTFSYLESIISPDEIHFFSPEKLKRAKKKRLFNQIKNHLSKCQQKITCRKIINSQFGATQKKKKN